MKTFTKLLVATAAAFSMASAANAAAFVQVATSGLTGANQIHWDGTAAGQGNLTVNDILTVINFDDTVFNDGILGQVAYLTLVGSTGGTGTLDTSLPNFTQTGIDGFFEFRTAAGGGGSLLLRGDFTDYWLTGVTGATAGNLSPLGGSLNFTSGVTDLSFVKGDNASFTFSNVAPAYGITGGQLNDFDGSNLSGTFAGVVPEPGTWALMILGFGGAGAMLRRRRHAFAAA
jgi:hypothetical protein